MCFPRLSCGHQALFWSRTPLWSLGPLIVVTPPPPVWSLGPIVVPFGSIVIPRLHLCPQAPLWSPMPHFGPGPPLWSLGPLIVPGPPCSGTLLCSPGPIRVLGPHCGPQALSYPWDPVIPGPLLWSPSPCCDRELKCCKIIWTKIYLMEKPPKVVKIIFAPKLHV